MHNRVALATAWTVLSRPLTARYIERGTESSIGIRAFISFVPLTSDDRAAASESAPEKAKQSEFANRLELHCVVAAFFTTSFRTVASKFRL